MLRNRTVVKWQILLDDSEWNSDRRPQIPLDDVHPAPSMAVSPHNRRLLWGSVGLLCLAVISAGYLLWRTAQAGLKTLEAELQEAVVLESWTPASEPVAVLTDTTNVQAAKPGYFKQAKVVMQTFDIRGGVAWTEVIVEDPALPLRYRETRFYRQTNFGWQRTCPSPEFWGPPQELESEHFVFLFSHRDLGAVSEAVPALEAVYIRMCQDLGLSPVDSEKLVIEIVAGDGPPASVNLNLVGRFTRLRLPSPTLLRLPVEVTEVEVLTQLVIDPLARHLLNRATRDWIVDVDWPLDWPFDTALAGIRFWIVWENEGLLANWYEEVAGWLYRHRNGVLVYQTQALPKGYQEFCQICDMWGVSPLNLALPVSCIENSDVDGSTFYFFPPLPTRLADLLSPISAASPPVRDDAQALSDFQAHSHEISLRNVLARDVASFTLIDYAINTYGRERLRVLLAALDTHRRWETLIPAVYGISADEFEAGWRRYLEEQYGQRTLSPALSR